MSLCSTKFAGFVQLLPFKGDRGAPCTTLVTFSLPGLLTWYLCTTPLWSWLSLMTTIIVRWMVLKPRNVGFLRHLVPLCFDLAYVFYDPWTELVTSKKNQVSLLGCSGIALPSIRWKALSPKSLIVYLSNSVNLIINVRCKQK